MSFNWNSVGSEQATMNQNWGEWGAPKKGRNAAILMLALAHLPGAQATDQECSAFCWRNGFVTCTDDCSGVTCSKDAESAGTQDALKKAEAEDLPQEIEARCATLVELPRRLLENQETLGFLDEHRVRSEDANHTIKHHLCNEYIRTCPELPWCDDISISGAEQLNPTVTIALVIATWLARRAW